MPKKLLFVCLGNICRSPAAEGIAREIFPDFEIDSAAIGSWHIGNPPDKRSINICRKHGIDISNQTARPLRIGDDEYYDHIFVMDEHMKEEVKGIFSEANHYKIQTLSNKPIADPYYGGDDGFETMFEHISSSLEELKKAGV